MATLGAVFANKQRWVTDDMLAIAKNGLALFVADPAAAKRAGVLPLRPPPLPANPLKVTRR